MISTRLKWILVLLLVVGAVIGVQASRIHTIYFPIVYQQNFDITPPNLPTATLAPTPTLTPTPTLVPTYRLTLYIIGDGSVDVEPDLATYDSGQVITLTAIADPDWEFFAWSGDLSGSDNPITLTMNNNKVVTATFTLIPDTIPPVISDIQSSTLATSATISWTTDEPATSRVDYGHTSAYEDGFVEDLALITNHSITLTGLNPNTHYHFQVTSADGSDNVVNSSDLSFSTNGLPFIDIWYGNQQSFGHLGVPQQWVNILGNVSDPDGIDLLTYSLNGGDEVILSIGPDDRRLADDGDFNVDIDYSGLVSGSNHVVVTAEDSLGYTAQETVTVSYSSGNIWPLPYSVDWATVTDIQDEAQVVDGLWGLVPGGVRTLQVDYDRVLDIGDLTWDDYEITVPITIHAIDSDGYQWPSISPGFGITFRWQGHTDSPVSCTQPHCGWLPSGAGSWYDIGQDGPLKLDGLVDNTVTMNVGDTFYWKYRVETTPGTGTSYSLKVWEAGQSEPAEWNLTKQRGMGDVANGSAFLVAHHVDLTIGNLTIIPVDATLEATMDSLKEKFVVLEERHQPE